ncbi:hypothetical protein LAZ67_8000974, partial [Cordylochernes scorpioides]
MERQDNHRDETWVYDYDHETKRQYAEWRGQDIAPNDFFLFPKLKAVLKGRHFDTRDDIIEKSPLASKSIPKEAYKNCFDNWEKRWRWNHHSQNNGNGAFNFQYFNGDGGYRAVNVCSTFRCSTHHLYRQNECSAT